MAAVDGLTVGGVAFLPERHPRGNPDAEELLRWAAWLDAGDHIGFGRDRSLDALIEASDGQPGPLTAAWLCAIRGRREGCVTRSTVELLRAAIDRADVDPPVAASLSLF
jgi:hypothetical protein